MRTHMTRRKDELSLILWLNTLLAMLIILFGGGFPENSALVFDFLEEPAKYAGNSNVRLAAGSLPD